MTVTTGNEYLNQMKLQLINHCSESAIVPDRQTASFIDISIEAGFLLSRNGAIVPQFGAVSIFPHQPA